MKLKRILSLLLALTLVSSFMMISTVSAANDEFALLRQLGFTRDFSDNTTPITRYQVAEVAIEMAGIGADLEGDPVYPDVPVRHKYFGVVNAAYKKGLVSAKPDGTFAPDSPATPMDAGRAILGELGYAAFGMQAGWTDAQYNNKVQTLGLLSGIKSSSGFTYYDFGKMIINALTVNIMDMISVGNEGVQFKESNLTYIESKYGYKAQYGILQAAGKASMTGTAPTDSFDQVVIKVNNTSIRFNTTGIDYSALVGQRVKFILSNNYGDGDLIYLEKYRGSRVIELDATDLDYDNNSFTYHDEYGRIKTQSFPVTARVIINGENRTTIDDRYYEPDTGSVTLVDTEDDGRIDVVHINSKVVFKVGATTQFDLLDAFTSNRITYGETKIYAYKAGANANIASIKVGDYVELAPGKIKFNAGTGLVEVDDVNMNRMTVNILPVTKISGSVTAIKATALYVDGVEYKFDGYFEKLVAYGHVSLPTLGAVVEIVVDGDGEIIDVPTVESVYSLNTDRKYAYMLGMAETSNESKDAVIRVMNIDILEEERFYTAEDCRLNGKKFDFQELKKMDYTTSSVMIYTPAVNPEYDPSYGPSTPGYDPDNIKTKQYIMTPTFKHQLISYVLDKDGKVKELFLATDHSNQYILDKDGMSTGVPNPDYVANYQGYSKTEFTMDIRGNLPNIDGATVLANIYQMDPLTTYQLRVPLGDDIYNPKMWFSVPPIGPDTRYRSETNTYIVAGSGSDGWTGPTLELYDNTESLSPTIIIRRENQQTTSMTYHFNDEQRAMLITDITTIYDEEAGKEKIQITGQVGTPDKGVVERKYNIYDPTTALITFERPKETGSDRHNSAIHVLSETGRLPATLADLEVGDLVEVQLNDIGEIALARVIADMEFFKMAPTFNKTISSNYIPADDTGNETVKWNLPTYGTLVGSSAIGAKTGQLYYVYGQVTNVYGDNGALMRTREDATLQNYGFEKIERPVFDPHLGGNISVEGGVAIIHTETGKMESATVADIQLSDNVIARKTYDRPVEVYIIRK